MGWVRLDDGFPRHPKVVALSDEAFRGYVTALCYAAEFETDGFVPETVAVNGPIREHLVKQGLWDNADGGVVIHDYLVYNPSHAEKESTRQSKRLAGAIGAATRYATTPSDSKGVGGSSSALASKNKEAFDLFWSIYPRKVGKRAAVAAFDAAVKRAPVTEIIAGAERLRDDPNRVDQYTPHATTWLRRDGWEDEALPARNSRKPDAAANALRKIRGER